MSTQHTDPRPPVWIGHVRMNSRSVEETTAFMLNIGMRSIVQNDRISVLELRGGTHLVIAGAEDGEPGDAEFDLMVEDVDATHSEYAAKGLTVSDIQRGRIHDSFTLTEPGGNRITVNSTHVSDQPV